MGATTSSERFGDIDIQFPTTNWPDWMAQLSDELSVSNLSIPGTNGSMNYYGTNVQRQTWPLYCQLEAGVRFLDIGCKLQAGKLEVYEGEYTQYANFEDILDEVSEFLTSFRSEVVLLHVRNISEGSSSTSEFVDVLTDKYLVQSRYKDRIYKGGETCALKLGEVRGKILVLHNFGKAPGIPYRSIDVVNVEFELREIISERVEEHLSRASTATTSTTFLTHFSGKRGSSDHSLPFRIAEEINDCLYKFIGERKSRFGIITIDFPRSELVERIIASNRIRKY
ncbi:1-phosphatidylinositol phosphodiesterase-like [Glandiceps talaboti]